MKVVIEIPKALYNRVKQLDYTADMYDFIHSMYSADIKNMAIAIKDGSHLPEELLNRAKEIIEKYKENNGGI